MNRIASTNGGYQAEQVCGWVPLNQQAGFASMSDEGVTLRVRVRGDTNSWPVQLKRFLMSRSVIGGGGWLFWS